MATVDFEGVLLDGSFHFRGFKGLYAVKLKGPNVKQVLPLVVGACMDEQATVTINRRTFAVKEVYWTQFGAKLVCVETTPSPITAMSPPTKAIGPLDKPAEKP